MPGRALRYQAQHAGAVLSIPVPPKGETSTGKQRAVLPAEGYSPRSALIKTTLILSLGNDFSVMVQVLQIRCGLLHSSQQDVLTQGVFLSSRMALAGAA